MAFKTFPTGEKDEKSQGDNLPNITPEGTISGIPLKNTGPTYYDYLEGNIKPKDLAVLNTWEPIIMEAPKGRSTVVAAQTTTLPLPPPRPPGYKLNFPHPTKDPGSHDPNKGWSKARP